MFKLYGGARHPHPENIGIFESISSLGEIVSHSLIKSRRHKKLVILIDYLQCVPTSEFDNEAIRLERMCKTIRDLSNRTNSVIFAAASLNNAETELLKRFKGSGSIGYMTDIAIVLSRKPKMPTGVIPIHVDIGKHRDGSTGEATLYFDGKKMHFESGY